MGFEDLSLGQIIRGVFGVLVTLLIVVIVFPLFHQISTAEAAGKGTRTTLGQAVGLFELYDADESSMPRFSTLPDFYLEDGFFLVGFDADVNAINDACHKAPLLRPLECPAGKACICLCQEKKGCRDEQPSCHSFQRIKRIAVLGTPQANFVGAKKAIGADNDLLVYGDCGITYAAVKPMTLYIGAVKGQERTVLVGKDRPVEVVAVDLGKPAAT